MGLNPLAPLVRYVRQRSGVLGLMIVANAAILGAILVIIYVQSSRIAEQTRVARESVAAAEATVIRLELDAWQLASRIRELKTVRTDAEVDQKLAIIRELVQRSAVRQRQLDDLRYAWLRDSEVFAPDVHEISETSLAAIADLSPDAATALSAHVSTEPMAAGDLLDIVDRLAAFRGVPTAEVLQRTRKPIRVDLALAQIAEEREAELALANEFAATVRREIASGDRVEKLLGGVLREGAALLLSMRQAGVEDTSRQQRLLHQVVVGDSPSRVRAATHRFARSMRTALRRLPPATAAPEVAHEERLGLLMADIDEAVALRLFRLTSRERMGELAERLNTTHDSTSALFASINALLTSRSEAASAALVTDMTRLTQVVTGLGLIALVLSVGAGWFTREVIVRPLRYLAARAKRVAGGDLSSDMALDNLATTGVEVSVLADAFGQMTRSLQEQQARLEELAYYDPLTKLPNRAHFRNELASVVAFAERYEHSAALMFIDLDGFKRINDTLGHEAGDRLLIGVGERLEACLRTSDSLFLPDLSDDQRSPQVSRLGGDEFTVIIPRVDTLRGVAIAAQRILDSLAHPISVGDVEVVTTPSIGIALFPDDSETADDLQRHADTAMYAAKNEGKNRYKVFDVEMEGDIRHRLDIERRLREALDAGAIDVHFQPQVCARDGRAIAFEALARWTDEELGSVSPGEFIPVAEESGLIDTLGDVVLAKSIGQLARWQASLDPDVVIAVNVAASQLARGNLSTTVEGLLEEHGAQASGLEIELTERVLMDEGRHSLEQLEHLREIGVHVAIDDFGTGYSSLAYLKRFPVDAVKIDQRFVRDIGPDTENGAIVTAICALARALGMRTVAEGVETDVERDELIARQVDVMQGWLFARAMPVDECEAWFEVQNAEAKAATG